MNKKLQFHFFLSFLNQSSIKDDRFLWLQICSRCMKLTELLKIQNLPETFMWIFYLLTMKNSEHINKTDIGDEFFMTRKINFEFSLWSCVLVQFWNLKFFQENVPGKPITETQIVRYIFGKSRKAKSWPFSVRSWIFWYNFRPFFESFPTKMYRNVPEMSIFLANAWP